MSLDHWVAVFSALVSFTGLLLVAVQMHEGTKQRRLDSLQQFYDVNRQLLSLGFSHPQLFDILTDTKKADPDWERRYLQMWLNQLSMIHLHLKQGGFDAELQGSLEREIADFMTLQNAQHYWKHRGGFFIPSFQRLVNGILSKIPAPRSVPHGS